MADNPPAEGRHLQIKKYPNRRFYDATHSRHVTLPALHALIGQGYEVTVHDAKSGADITNLVLTQIILERDADKLSIFPPNILHQVIRTQHQLLGGVVEQFFRQTLDAYRTSQERWADFLRNTLGAAAPAGQAPPSLNPFEWTQAWMTSLMPQAAPKSPSPASDSPMPESRPSSAANSPSDVDDLRRQLAELTRRIEGLSRPRE